MSFDSTYKLVLIGDQDVGKSSLLTRFADNTFQDTTAQTTTIDSKSRIVTDGTGRNIRMNIWDTAGQERFRTITSSYYRGADGIVIAFDICNPKSFENLGVWLTQSERYAADNVALIIVGNKTDLAATRQVTEATAKAFAEDRGIPYFETSAKTGDRVDDAFMRIAEEITKALPPEEPDDDAVVDLEGPGGEKGGCKC